MAVCLHGDAFGDEQGRLARALRHPIAQRDAGGAVFVIKSRASESHAEASQLHACQGDAAKHNMTPVFIVQQETIDGFHIGGRQHTTDSEAYMLDSSKEALVL
jgi:hypothetical protein